MNTVHHPLPSGRPRAAGFTLLELLVTMVIAGILLAIAVPSFLSAIRGQQTADIASKFSQDVAWARGEAVAGHTVAMTINADGSWQTTEDGGAADADHSLSSAQLLADAPGVVCSLGGGSCASAMTFTSTGIVNGAPVGTMQYSSASMSSAFQVFASGAVVVNPSYAS